MMKRIAIFGAGGFAREVLMLLRDINRMERTWEVCGFIDDDPARIGQELDGIPVIGGRDWLSIQHDPVHLALGVGSPVVKKRLAEDLRSVVAGFPPLIHPAVLMSRYVEVGQGAIITAGNILTSQIRLGDFAMLNLMCTVGHDCSLGDYVTLSPGCNVSGNVTIGTGCDVGTGSKIIQGVSIGEWSIVGAGSVVTRDLPNNCTAVGVPSKVINERPVGWQES